jgi:hypothetical protein
MDTQLWVAAHQEMHVIGHHFYANEVLSPLVNRLQDDLLEPFIDAVDQHLAPILGTKDHMIVAIENNRYIVLNCSIHA